MAISRKKLLNYKLRNNIFPSLENFSKIIIVNKSYRH